MPLSWNKTVSGDTVAWMGFELLQARDIPNRSRLVHQMDTRYSQSGFRHEPLRGGPRSDHVRCRGPGVREALPRASLSFHCTAPARVHQTCATVRFLFLSYRSRLVIFLAQLIAPRVDAQASSERTGKGGWLPDLGEDGKPRTATSLSFSHEIKQYELPWVFERGGKSSLLISSLEALAVVVALKVFFPPN